MAIAGLKLIVPSSVAGTGVSVSATGKVSFSGSSAVNVNGCFSSSYDNYTVIIRAISSLSGVLTMRYRVSSSDASGTDYARQYFEANNTPPSASRVTGLTYADIGYTINTNYGGIFLSIYGPALTQPTASRTTTISTLNSGYIRDDAVIHGLSTAYDGFSVIPSSGNLTGALTIYGLSQ